MLDYPSTVGLRQPYTPARERGCVLGLDRSYGITAAVGSPVSDWRGRAGGAKLVTGSGSTRPTLRAGGVESDGGDYLDLDATLSLLDCSMYCVVDMNSVAGGYHLPLGSGTGANEVVGVYASTMYWGGTDQWTRAYTGSGTRALWRFCRIGTDMRFAATGQADAAMTPTGSPAGVTQNFHWLLARQAFGTYSANTTKLCQLWVFARSLGIDTPADLRVRRWIARYESVTL